MSTNNGSLLWEESGKDWKFSSCTSTVSIERRISLKWSLEKFFLHPRDATIWSTSFNFLSFEWSLGLRPVYRHSVPHDWLALSLRMENPKSETEVKGKMCVKGRNNEDHCVEDFEHVFSAEERTCSRILTDRYALFINKELLSDDVLTVCCEISGKQNVDRGVDRSTTTDTESFAVPKHFQVLIDDLETRLEDHKSCDVTLRVGDEKFPAHKFLLETRSKVFAAMFDHDTEESRSGIVTITDIDAELVSDLLQYIYSGQVKDMSVEKAIGLYSAADKYALLDLKDQCGDFLRRNLSEENMCDSVGG